MRVVIAEDQALLRAGMARLFQDGGHDIVATMGDATDLVALVGRERPDLVVVDIRMPPTFTDEGAQAAREIKQKFPAVGVLVLSQHIETNYAVELVALGGFGYLLKDRVLDVSDFLDAADRIAIGGSALDPMVVGHLVRPHGDGPVGRLSDTERRVLEAMAQGFTNAGIAARLFVSERTVEAHIRHILVKLDIGNSDDGHRRVLAVLTYLNNARP
jgi:DNA-binding NarL/FixJ family response regulator